VAYQDEKLKNARAAMLALILTRHVATHAVNT
jgi:hypothetical protein